MVAEVKVLIKGFIDLKKDTGWSTISLIIDKDIIMVVDPGTVRSQKDIADALKKEGLNINDVNYVGISHSHLDHYRNIGMFPKAKSIDYWGIWDKDKLISKNWDCDLSKNIHIMKTPGHSSDGITFFVKSNEGIIAICGDIFWKKNFPKDGEDPFVNDQNLLIGSRKKILERADWIIPGHENIFKSQFPPPKI